MSISAQQQYARYWSIEYCADREQEWWVPWSGAGSNRFLVKADALRRLRRARHDALRNGFLSNGMYRVVEYTRTRVVNR